MSSPTKTLWLGKTTATPLGILWFVVSDKGLIALTIDQETNCKKLAQKLTGQKPEFSETITAPYAEQLAHYFGKTPFEFDLAIDWTYMSPFQQHVLQTVRNIPYGTTATYKDIAKALGKPQASRAIGRSNARNPLPVIIPCHRVISSNGNLCGYSAGNGIITKQWLLDFEKR